MIMFHEHVLMSLFTYILTQRMLAIMYALYLFIFMLHEFAFKHICLYLYCMTLC